MGWLDLADKSSVLPPSIPWWATWSLASVVVTAFLAAVFVFHDDVMKTALITLASAAGGYFWHSSSDSAKKTDIIAASPPVVTSQSNADELNSEEVAEALNAAEVLRNRAAGAPAS